MFLRIGILLLFCIFNLSAGCDEPAGKAFNFRGESITCESLVTNPDRTGYCRHPDVAASICCATCSKPEIQSIIDSLDKPYQVYNIQGQDQPVGCSEAAKLQGCHFCKDRSGDCPKSCEAYTPESCSCIDRPSFNVNGPDGIKAYTCEEYLSLPSKLCRCNDEKVELSIPNFCCAYCQSHKAEVAAQCGGGEADSGDAGSEEGEDENECKDVMSAESHFTFTMKNADGTETVTKYTSCEDVKNDDLCDTNAKKLCCVTCADEAGGDQGAGEGNDEAGGDQGAGEGNGDGANEPEGDAGGDGMGQHEGQGGDGGDKEKPKKKGNKEKPPNDKNEVGGGKGKNDKGRKGSNKNDHKKGGKKDGKDGRGKSGKNDKNGKKGKKH